MKNFLPFLIIGMIGVTLVGCMGSKKMAKQGTKLVQQGMYEEASMSFYNSLMRNRNNLDARIGLKSTGQQVLNNRLQDFTRARMSMTAGEAVYTYMEAEKYVDKIKGVGVVLEIPEIYLKDFDNSKQTYLAELYESGTSMLEEENFNGAEAAFIEIMSLDPNYVDVDELRDIANIEPKYRRGVIAMDEGKFRSAYADFIEVVRKQADYKDASKRQDECLAYGQFTLAVLPIKNGTNNKATAVQLNAYVLQALTDIRDPFLKIVDRENINDVIEEQHLQLTGVMDQNTAVEVGSLIGAKAIVTGTLLSHSTDKGKLTSQIKTGFIERKIKKHNKEEDTYSYVKEYKKTTYREYYNENEAYVSLQYKVISLLTGEVLASEIIERKVTDEVHYAVFDGNIDKLFPSKSASEVNTNKSAYNELQNLLKASRDINSVQELTQDLFRTSGSVISNDVERLMKQLIP